MPTYFTYVIQDLIDKRCSHGGIGRHEGLKIP